MAEKRLCGQAFAVEATDGAETHYKDIVGSHLISVEQTKPCAPVVKYGPKCPGLRLGFVIVM